jgi:hypothetical protein
MFAHTARAGTTSGHTWGVVTLNRILRYRVLPLVVALSLVALVAGAAAQGEDEIDIAFNVPLPCEAIGAVSATPFGRSNRNIVHVSNTCGIVGTDIELQSRTHAHADATNHVHDYAILGTMGSGLRIHDVTNPMLPTFAGGYADPGWENDVTVWGNFAVTTFDGVSGEDSTASVCLKTNYPEADGQGVDVFKLNYNPSTAMFTVSNLGCVPDPPGGAHNATWNPTGQWFGISNCCSDWALDLVDARGLKFGHIPVHRWRFIDESRATASRCPAPITEAPCVIVRGPGGASASGLWEPHDVHFTADGKTMFVAAIQSTFIVDVSNALNGVVNTLAIIPNGPASIQISHQADVTSDGAILIVSDEKGGGLTNTECNTNPDGNIGGLHFYALKPLTNLPATNTASLTNPILIGSYYNPNPLLGPDVLQPAIDVLRTTFPRTERGCTAHVFRLGGNGNTSIGPGKAGLGGVSDLPKRQLSEAWYGAGVWWIDFSKRSRSDDGIVENPTSTWGNTLGWNVQPGADTWSAKEYKHGYVFAGDMLRGFDVYQLQR